VQIRPAYPPDTVTGGCFISRDYEETPVIDLDIYMDALPPFGRMCVSPKAVRMMMAALGWKQMTQDEHYALDDLQAANDRLTMENHALRSALGNIIEAAALCELVQVAELAGDFPALQQVRT
jgi:hypothetical protein